jgi:hypothetical protein
MHIDISSWNSSLQAYGMNTCARKHATAAAAAAAEAVSHEKGPTKSHAAATLTTIS